MTFCERKEKTLEQIFNLQTFSETFSTEDNYERKCFPITSLPHRDFAPNYSSVKHRLPFHNF